MNDLICADESYAIRGAVFEVYRTMGPGFLEAVYQECLAKEFVLCGIPFKEQSAINLSYKGQPLAQAYRADFICFDKVIVEIKAASALAKEHEAQVFNYLKSTGYPLGLLVNFGAKPKVHIERFVL